MAKKIFKYTILDFTTTLPAGAQILTIAPQTPDTLCIWAIVDEDEVKPGPIIKTIYTGHKATQPIDQYYGTFILREGNIVLHIFIVPE